MLHTFQLSLTRLTRSNYETDVNNMRSIIRVEKLVTVLHVPFAPSGNPSPALGANTKVGVTEIVLFYFPSDSDEGAIMASVDKMRPVIERSEALAIHDGWALEEVPNPGSQESEKEKTKVFVSLVGCPTRLFSFIITRTAAPILLLSTGIV